MFLHTNHFPAVPRFALDDKRARMAHALGVRHLFLSNRKTPVASNYLKGLLGIAINVVQMYCGTKSYLNEKNVLHTNVS